MLVTITAFYLSEGTKAINTPFIFLLSLQFQPVLAEGLRISLAVTDNCALARVPFWNQT